MIEFEQMNSVITVKNLVKIFPPGTRAVRNISFEVLENEILGIIGPNGSGKTTTLRILATVLAPTSGKISYLGDHLSGSQAREFIGYVPQGDCLYRDLTVWENLDIFSRPYRLKNTDRLKKINELLETLELTDRRNTLVKNLSSGLTKRVSIASSLIHDPKILFMDEITMGLDPRSRHDIWELLKKLREDTAIVMTTHYMNEAQNLCDRIAILAKGKILELAPPNEIVKKYRADNLNDTIVQIIEKEK